MNEATKNFVTRLEADDNVLGVILFGSWARGNNRPGSDVDLVIILRDGYQRCVETHEGQVFEIIYTKPEAALEFWQANKNDCHSLWSVAKILLDKEGIIEELQKEAQKVIDAGKPEINEKQKEQFRFDKEDKLNYVTTILESDSTTAKLILNNLVFEMTGLYFDLRQLWSPAPKQRVEEIKKTIS